MGSLLPADLLNRLRSQASQPRIGVASGGFQRRDRGRHARANLSQRPGCPLTDRGAGRSDHDAGERLGRGGRVRAKPSQKRRRPVVYVGGIMREKARHFAQLRQRRRPEFFQGSNGVLPDFLNFVRGRVNQGRRGRAGIGPEVR